MRHIDRSGNFKRQYKLMQRRGLNEQKILRVIQALALDEPLASALRDHPLTGNLKGFRDCHIEPDWLLIYKKQSSTDGRGVLYLEATGTHADLFD